jgi:hypothetical protein
MDFRSQLSAFQNKGGGGGSGGRGGHGNSHRHRNDRSHSPQNTRRYDNSNNSRSNNNINNGNKDYYDRGGGGGGGNIGGRYGYGTGEGGYGGDRRRPRPFDWGGNTPQTGGAGVGPPSSRRRYNDHNPPTDPDGLGDLRGYGYNNITRGFPDPPTEEEKSKKPKHIALMAITIKDMPYEHLWKGWCDTFQSVDKEQDDYFISLVCHAKYPLHIKSEWLKQRLLTYPPKRGRGNSFEDPTFLTRTPAWGSIDITRAMLDLLQESLKIGYCTQPDKRFSANRFVARVPPNFDAGNETCQIPPVDHFLFISETCIPVATAPEFFAQIDNLTVSWVNARHRRQENTPKNKYEDDQFAGIHRRIPGQYRWKADQWVLLSRRHAARIIDMDRPHKPIKHQLWQSFRDINASDEMYFPTALALLGYLRYTKEGEDTQKSRSLVATTNQPPIVALSTATNSNNTSAGHASSTMTTMSNQGTATPLGVVATAAVATTTTTTTTTITTTVVNKNDCILLRPVTYTDWTAGMKNPAMFVHGIKDLKRVGKIARANGCLVARKFFLYLPIPGIPMEEQKITGEISVDHWNEMMAELHAEEKVDAPPGVVQLDPSETLNEGAESKNNKAENNQPIEHKQPIENKVGIRDDGEANVEDEALHYRTKFVAPKKAVHNDDDDDQEENELE